MPVIRLNRLLAKSYDASSAVGSERHPFPANLRCVERFDGVPTHINDALISERRFGQTWLLSLAVVEMSIPCQYRTIWVACSQGLFLGVIDVVRCLHGGVSAYPARISV